MREDKKDEVERTALRGQSGTEEPRTAATPPVAVILGIPFYRVTFAETVEWVRERVRSRRPAYIATANMDFVTQAWRDPELQRILLEADLVVADGIPIVWLSRLLGPPLKERVTGSDLVPMFAELAAREGFSLYGLGGAEGVAEKALNKLAARYPGMRIAGFYSPPKAEIIDMDNPGILARLAEANPDILLVAFGGPKQEKWCNMHIRQWKVPVAIGIGGSLDFLAGAQKRAPRWVQKLALEWLWRMFSDPRRLFRRYVANIAFFLAAVVRLLRLRWGPIPPAAKTGATTAVPPATADESAVRRVAFPASAAARDVEAFRSACEAAPDRPLVVDMGARDWLDSRELGDLLDLNRRRHLAHRWLCVLAPHARLAHMLRFVRLDHYIHVASDMPEALGRLHAWNQTSKEGSVRVEPGQRLVAVLPAELTAANVAEFRAGVEAAWNKTAEVGEVTGVAVDASSVTFLDSAGLGFLVTLRKKALPLPGGFRCTGFRGNARRTLVIARMENLFAADAPGSGGTP
jgi:N-acetylglucosaminyldiphosphoundecaprenol N-acetyl-beta-D-mannosaminyltransferase